MNVTPDFLILILLFLWVCGLSYVVYRIYTTYSNLSKNGKKESVAALVNDVLAQEEKNSKILDQLMAAYDKINKDSQAHIQKIGLVRFNPFKDTGGDQSFILALVDAEDTGVVISSLHTRTGTRWYAKSVVKGKGTEYELSDDEIKALRGARLLAQTVK
jgi:hypothetical protein